jgi:FemAB-related protein (PEP-CTERM system-associated)
MTVAVRSLDDVGAAAWDAFVTAHPDGTFFHRAAWAEIIAKAFGHRAFYVCAERDGAITGVLPLARVKTLLFGDTLISVPFCVYGGPLAVDAETAAALHRHATSLLKQTGSSAVEFRYRGGNGDADDGWLERSDLYVTFRKPIVDDHDKNMKAIPRKQRAMVRKGIQNNLRSVADHDAATSPCWPTCSAMIAMS